MKHLYAGGCIRFRRQFRYLSTPPTVAAVAILHLFKPRVYLLESESAKSYLLALPQGSSASGVSPMNESALF